MASYQDEILGWRMQRRQQEAANRVEQIKWEHREAARERDRALAEGDVSEAEMRDQDCEQLEAEYNQYCPPQAPQLDPRLVQFANRNRQFLERYGTNAYAALDAAHQYMLRPRRSDTTNPALTGMGWSPQHVYTPAYFDRLKTLMEMHGEQFLGVKYDRNEESLTPNEAAKISGLSPEQYNNSLRQVAAAGLLGRKR